MKPDGVYLAHILDAITRIEQYLVGINRAMFHVDHMRQDAVVRQLEIIGEACRQVSEAVRIAHTEVSWRAIIGMRNRIAHDYINIDVDVVWETATGSVQQVRLKEPKQGITHL